MSHKGWARPKGREPRRINPKTGWDYKKGQSVRQRRTDTSRQRSRHIVDRRESRKIEYDALKTPNIKNT
jgi:hypothetical protein